jgi:hypothetical protein
MPALYTSQVFPGGQEKILVITATAGNVITDLSPGIGLRWKILRGRIVLINDATIANRNILFSVTNGTNLISELGLGVVATATQTTVLQMIDGVVPIAGSLVGQNWPNIGLIGGPVLTDADQLRITIVNGVVGDSYSGRVAVLEMAVS